MKRQLLGLMLAGTLAGAGYAHAGLLIDNFQTAQAELAITSNGGGNDGTSVPSSAMGTGIVPSGAAHTRDVTLTLVTGTVPGQEVTTTTSFSLFSQSSGSGAHAKTLLVYDNLGGVDLTGPDDDKDWFIFHTINIDQDLVVTVELIDTAGEVATNTYVKFFNQGRTECLIPGGGAFCPQIVGPIYDVNIDTNPAIEGNYYHALDAFVNGGIDPVTSDPFGGHNTSINLNSINKISITFDSVLSNQQLTISCIHTGAAPSGTKASDPGVLESFNPATGAGAFFPLDGGDNAENNQCADIPEPNSILLLGTGFLGLGLAGLRARSSRRRQQA